jgi:hypothetical protein
MPIAPLHARGVLERACTSMTDDSASSSGSDDLTAGHLHVYAGTGPPLRP